MYRFFRLALVAAILLLCLMALIGFIEARSIPVVRRATIVMRGVPADTPPLRVALMSDIHVGNLAMPVGRLNRIVAQVDALHPDAILLAGDYVNGVGKRSWDYHPELLAAPLSHLRAPLGVFAILGNHDDDTSSAQVGAALKSAGITVLHQQAVRLGPIALIGLDNWRYPPAALPSIMTRLVRPMGGMPVLIQHPPPFAGLVERDIPVILAGHTHCGQIVLPGWDNSFDPFHLRARFPPETRCGLVRYDHHLEIVTGGVGAATAMPLRINAPPDIWVITFVGQR